MTILRFIQIRLHIIVYQRPTVPIFRHTTRLGLQPLAERTGSIDNYSRCALSYLQERTR